MNVKQSHPCNFNFNIQWLIVTFVVIFSLQFMNQIIDIDISIKHGYYFDLSGDGETFQKSKVKHNICLY